MSTQPTLTCRTAGLLVQLCSTSRRWIEFAREAFAGQVLPPSDETTADVRVVVASRRQPPFSHEGMRLLTRGAWTDGTSVLLEDACTSGMDLRFTPGKDRLEIEARCRPSWTTRALGLAAPGRSVLLLRDALLQYPAMWWAGRDGWAPLHVSALRVGDQLVALAGPGGVGKSTLVRAAVAEGAWPVSDNLCVGHGTELAGVLEPLRSEGGSGRKMPHGRRESVWRRRVAEGTVNRLLVLQRGGTDHLVVRPIDTRTAADVVAGGTYAAGELRRYWAFAATLALGTGVGPVHPRVEDAATELCAAVPCTEVLLPDRLGTRLEDLIASVDAASPSRS
jgi:hypothetical protein